MFRVLFPILLIVIPYFCSSQSVTEALEKSFLAQNPEEGLRILNKVSDKINKEVLDSIKLDYFIAKGVAHGQLGNADSSFFFLDKAEIIGEKLSDDIKLIKVYNTKGLVLMGLSKYEEALDVFQKGLVMGEGEKGDGYLVAVRKLLGNSAGIFYELGDFDAAIRNTLRALDISKQLNDSSGLAYNNLRLAISYQATDSLDKCIERLEHANQLLQYLGDTTTLLYVESTLGLVFDKKRDYENALIHYQEGNKLANAIKNEEEMTHTKLSIGETYFSLGQIEKSEEIAEEVINKTKQNGMANHRQNAYDLLYTIEEQKQNWKQALYYRNKSIEIKDSISNAEVKSSIAELETKYETEKKQKEIKELEYANNLQQLSIENAEQERKFLITGVVLAVVMVLVLLWMYKLRTTANKALSELNSTKDRLFSIVAHDLKNPLSAFKNLSKSLSENYDNIPEEDRKKSLEVMDKSATGVYELLQNLLMWALSESDRLTPDMQIVSVKAQTDQVVKQLETVAEVNKINLENNIDENLQVKADQKMLTTILRNLISNALKFTPANGMVKIEAKNQNGKLELNVIDSGSGIAEKDLDKLFDPKADRNTIKSNGKKGTGLGLILCKELVEKMGGKIWATSKEGQGSKFSLSLVKVE